MAILITNNQTSIYGDSVIAACGIVSRIILLGVMVVMGFMKGYQLFVGYNYGANRYERLYLYLSQLI